MFTFAWWWIFLALPLPWLVRRWMSPEPVDRSAALKVPSAAVFEGLAMRGTSTASHWHRLVLLSLLWLLVLSAAARPQWLGEPVVVEVTGRDLLLAVDLSGSMEERDFQLNGEWVDRLTAIKALATQFIDRRTGDRLGLILFGREAYLQTPLTFDRATVKTLLDEAVIGLPGRQTAIGDAIGLAIRTLEDAGVEEGRRVLILLTDGANTAGVMEPLRAAQIAAQRSMIIYPIGIGADRVTIRTLFGVREVSPSTDLDEESLTAIAEITGGAYFRARSTAEFEAIYQELDRLEPAGSVESGFRPVTELFYWPLGLAWLLALAWMALSLLAAHLPDRRSWREVAGG
jgi:Ca-activated chloride channel homolog